MPIVGIDSAGLAKLISSEIILNPLNHCVDAGVALTTHHWVDVACVVGPGFRDQLVSLIGVGRVPYREIALD
jgi:hypothetical protein